MIIRRITLTLPATMRHSAEHDARAIAEALAHALSARGGPAKISLELPYQGRSGPVLGVALAGQMATAQMPTGGRHGR